MKDKLDKPNLDAKKSRPPCEYLREMMIRMRPISGKTNVISLTCLTLLNF